MGFPKETIPFFGIFENAYLRHTEVCTISEGYNPTSKKGFLRAVKINERVELSPDGESHTENGSKFNCQ